MRRACRLDKELSASCNVATAVQQMGKNPWSLRYVASSGAFCNSLHTTCLHSLNGDTRYDVHQRDRQEYCWSLRRTSSEEDPTETVWATGGREGRSTERFNASRMARANNLGEHWHPCGTPSEVPKAIVLPGPACGTPVAGRVSQVATSVV